VEFRSLVGVGRSGVREGPQRGGRRCNYGAGRSDGGSRGDVMIAFDVAPGSSADSAEERAGFLRKFGKMAERPKRRTAETPWSGVFCGQPPRLGESYLHVFPRRCR